MKGILLVWVLWIACWNSFFGTNGCNWCQASAAHLTPSRRRWQHLQWNSQQQSAQETKKPGARNPRTDMMMVRGGEAAWKSGIKNSMASALAAATSKLLLAPLDTIKTLQQSQRASGQATLTLLEAAKEIMKRPKGVFELYVRGSIMRVENDCLVSAVSDISNQTICTGTVQQRQKRLELV